MSGHVLVIGNPLMDQLTFVNSDDIARLGISPGSMSLIESSEADRLSTFFDNWVLAPGGSETNTAVGIASLGGKVNLIGAIADDELGKKYQDDLRRYETIDINFEIYEQTVHRMGTGASYVLVLPDGERTMLTYLGASRLFSAKAIEKSYFAGAKAVYFDAYILDLPAGPDILDKLFGCVQDLGTTVIFGLADMNVVERHYDVINALTEKIDVLLANEAEIKALMKTDDVTEALFRLPGEQLRAAVTRGDKGAVIYENKIPRTIEAVPVEKVIDTTGAGDQFAAGICFGILHDMSFEAAARLGAAAAAEVIGHLGARPDGPLLELTDNLNLGA